MLAAPPESSDRRLATGSLLGDKAVPNHCHSPMPHRRWHLLRAHPSTTERSSDFDPNKIARCIYIYIIKIIIINNLQYMKILEPNQIPQYMPPKDTTGGSPKANNAVTCRRDRPTPRGCSGMVAAKPDNAISQNSFSHSNFKMFKVRGNDQCARDLLWHEGYSYIQLMISIILYIYRYIYILIF